MSTERQRLLQLALESLENKRKQIDLEIAELTRELRGGRGRKAAAAGGRAANKGAGRTQRAHFSREERARRSQRMKAYWEKRRKQKSRQ
jgi:hypothetical protein